MTELHDVAPKGPSIVYVRPVDVADLPEQVRKRVNGATQLYALHDAEGAPVALVKDRLTAFTIARENDMTLMSVH